MKVPAYIALALLAAAAAGCSEEVSDRSTTGSASTPEMFPTEPIGGVGHFECVEGQRVRVYEFSSAGARDRAVDALDPADASRVGGASIAWTGDPIFWRSGDHELVMYAGSDGGVINRLDDELGERVSQGRGRPASPDAFAC